MSSERGNPEGARREAEMQTLKKLTDEALLLKPKFDRLPLAVYRALDNHGYRDEERSRMYRAIMKEMTRRSQARAKTVRQVKQLELTPTQAPDAKSEPSSSNVTAEILRDARAHELRQPPSTYDPDHPENSP